MNPTLSKALPLGLLAVLALLAARQVLSPGGGSRTEVFPSSTIAQEESTIPGTSRVDLPVVTLVDFNAPATAAPGNTRTATGSSSTDTSSTTALDSSSSTRPSSSSSSSSSTAKPSTSTSRPITLPTITITVPTITLPTVTVPTIETTIQTRPTATTQVTTSEPPGDGDRGDDD